MPEPSTIIERKVGADTVKMDHPMGGAIIELPDGFQLEADKSAPTPTVKPAKPTPDPKPNGP